MAFTIVHDGDTTQVRASLKTPHDFNELIEKLIGKRDDLVKQIEEIQSSDEPLPPREPGAFRIGAKTGDHT